MNKCYRCKETKPIEEMSPTKGFCKPCKKAYTKEYNIKNRERILEYSRSYNEENRELVRERARIYIHTPKCKETRKAYKEKNREKVLLEKKRYNSKPEVKEKKKLKAKERYEKIKSLRPPKPPKVEKVVKVKPPVRTLEEKRAYRRAYRKHKMATDIHYRIRTRLSKRLYETLGRSYTKSATTLTLLGCDVVFLRAYLENKFLPTMTWDNYGTLWHIDHILPCASFDLSDPEQQNKCFHYSNLQPLFAVTTIIDGIEYIGNINKGDKIIQLAA